MQDQRGRQLFDIALGRSEKDPSVRSVLFDDCLPRREYHGGSAVRIEQAKDQGRLLRRKAQSVWRIGRLLRVFQLLQKLKTQAAWDASVASAINTMIIAQKIVNQAAMLRKYGFDDRAELLDEYVAEIELDDAGNREGHAAKVYFNTLFGKDFTREKECAVNAALNYGYSIVLSDINRAVVACGRSTQIGINHCNEFNEFNFSCDLIEPLRVIVDEYVYLQGKREFDKNYKFELVGLLNKRVKLDREYSLHDAIGVYVKNITDSLDRSRSDELLLYKFE